MRRLLFPLMAIGLSTCDASQPNTAELGPPLRPCPPTPNCVTTETRDSAQGVPAVPFSDSPIYAQTRARMALLAEPRTQIVVERPGYLHAESRSRIFRFVDDVQIVVDSSARVFRMRSASRRGRNDFGVNRGRLERISGRLRAIPPNDSG